MTKNKGLINKYIIRRVDGTPINPDNHYFVLKYEGDGDEKHINACRKALRVYAEEVRDFLPELSEELVATLRRLDTITRLEVLHKMAVEEGMFNDTTPITPEPPVAVTTNSAQEEVFTLLDAMEKRLNPEYENDVYTWHKIKEVLEDEVTKLSNRLFPVAPREVTDEEITEKSISYSSGMRDAAGMQVAFCDGAEWMRDLLTKAK